MVIVFSSWRCAVDRSFSGYANAAAQMKGQQERAVCDAVGAMAPQAAMPQSLSWCRDLHDELSTLDTAVESLLDRLGPLVPQGPRPERGDGKLTRDDGIGGVSGTSILSNELGNLRRRMRALTTRIREACETIEV
jgi:hypothetical protein